MKILTVGSLCLLLFGSCQRKTQLLSTVPTVDLTRYAGKWYEIASMPTRFQKNCSCTTAEYSAEGDGVRVVNTCLNAENGKTLKIEGKATPVEGSNNSRLKVKFFAPFKGDYYLIALANDYSYAMVGTPERDNLWILSRQPTLNAETLLVLKTQAGSQGFDVNKLTMTKQNGCP